jgi:ubiquinone biosynthesis protein
MARSAPSYETSLQGGAADVRWWWHFGWAVVPFGGRLLRKSGQRLSLALFDATRLLRSVSIVVNQAALLACDKMFSRSGTVSLGAALRISMQTLGVTYVKLGQYLALRTDLLPRDIIQELNQLFDRAVPLDPATVRRQLEHELGRPLEEVFSEFCFDPLGSASIGQVHWAKSRDGEPLAVKVERPGVTEVFAADVRNILRLAHLIDALGLSAKNSLTDLVQEFADFTLREMDFRQEAGTAERLGKEMTAGTLVPLVRFDLTTERVLTMEYIEGISLLKICELAQAGDYTEIEKHVPGIDFHEIVRRLTESFLHQVFVACRFHGDPHFGNIMIRPDGTPVFIDWGIYGEISKKQRDQLRNYIESWASGDENRAAYAWTKMSKSTNATDQQRYRRMLAVVLKGWNAVSRDTESSDQDRHIAGWQNKIFQVMRRNAVSLPPEQLLVWRAITVLEASALKLPFRYDLISLLADFFARHPSEQNSLPKVLSRRVTPLSDLRQAFQIASLGTTELNRAHSRGQKLLVMRETCVSSSYSHAARTCTLLLMTVSVTAAVSLFRWKLTVLGPLIVMPLLILSAFSERMRE